MRRYEDACMGCGAMGGECLHCTAEIIECDGCGSYIDEAYAFPDDSSDEDYCATCMKNRIMDEAETTHETICPYCDAEGVEVFQIEFNNGSIHDNFMFCNECIHGLLTEFEKED